MAEDEYDYKVGPGRPPLHTRFKKGQSGNPDGRRKKNMRALLADALDQPVFVTIDGERRQIAKREAVVHQLFDAALGRIARGAVRHNISFGPVLLF